MAELLLTNGLVALLDDADYERLKHFHWFASKQGDVVYVKRTSPTIGGHRRSIYLHREILNAPADRHVDHRDHNTLDNRRSNLRVCSVSENLRNQRIGRANTSGSKGVSWDKTRSKWQAGIKLNGRRIALGRFDSRDEADRAYRQAADRLFGEFANHDSFPRIANENLHQV